MSFTLGIAARRIVMRRLSKLRNCLLIIFVSLVHITSENVEAITPLAEDYGYGATYGSAALDRFNSMRAEAPDSRSPKEILTTVESAIQDLAGVIENRSAGLDSVAAVDIRRKLAELFGTKAYLLKRSQEDKTLVSAYYTLAGATYVEATKFTKDFITREFLFERAGSSFQSAGSWELARAFRGLGPPVVLVK